MSKTDVVVIGGGFAGLMAALISAEENKSVTLLTYGAGTFPLNSGLIDLLGYDEKQQSVESPKAALKDLAKEHPYHKIGYDTVELAIQYFQRLSKRQGFPYVGTTEKQQWIPTAAGQMKPSCLVPESMQGNICFEKKNIVLAGIKNLKDYDAQLKASNIKKWLGDDKKYQIMEIETGMESDRDLTTLDIARWYNNEKNTESLLGQLKSMDGEDTVFLLPQILGTQHAKVYSRLQAELKGNIVESTGLPPSPNGMRLRDMLLAALRQRNVRIVEKAKVTGAIGENNVCKAVIADTHVREQTYYADRFILATGGFYSGGLSMEGFGNVSEPIFHLPVQFEEAEDQWSNEKMFSSEKQAFAKAGICTDDSLRPVDAAGRVLYENIFVIGRNLGGYDFCYEHSGNGVALASAYKAAMAK